MQNKQTIVNGNIRAQIKQNTHKTHTQLHIKQTNQQTLMVNGNIRALGQHTRRPLCAAIERIAKKLFHTKNAIHICTLWCNCNTVTMKVGNCWGIIILKKNRVKKGVKKE